MRYPDLLGGDVSRVGPDSQRYNLLSGRLVTDIVRTSLGPRGMEKMYIDILGEDTLTGHGGAFLRKVDTVHPAAKSVVEAVNTVDTHVGDGTATVAVLIGALLGRAESMIQSGIPTGTITRGYCMCLDHTLDILDGIAVRADGRDRKMMRNIVSTCLAGKAICELQGEGMDIAGIMIDAVDAVYDPGTGSVLVDDIKIEEKPGSVEELRLVRGTVIDRTVDGSAMPRDIRDARILLLNEPLEAMRTRTESVIEITSAPQMSRFAGREDADILDTVRGIADSGADVVISRKGISGLAQEALAMRGIASVRRVKYNDLWWLEKATGASTCGSVGAIRTCELGYADAVYERDVGGDRMVFVESSTARSVTLLLRANSKRYLDEFHRNALNALYALRNFVENPVIVYGGGSSEMIVARRIRERAPLIEGKEQVVAEGFADAAEQVPLVLAQNAGMDVLDAMAGLRSARGMGWLGIDSEYRRVSEMSSSGIVECVDVKRQVFKTAVEAANLILNIDDVFMKDLIDNTHCHVDGTVHAHHDGGKAHNHFEQEGLEQRQMHQYY